MASKKRISKKRIVVKKAVIDHTYRNHSRDLVPKSSASKDARFPAKLYRMLSKPENADIIAWRPHGRAWRVVDKHKLNSILPEYFEHASRDSFNRSTNNWGFKRLHAEGPDKKSYYHQLFLRGRPDLANTMILLKNPGRRLPDKSTEPDFYEISEIYPLPETTPEIDCQRAPSRIFTPTQATTTYFTMSKSTGTDTLEDRPPDHGCNHQHHPHAYPPMYLQPPRYTQAQSYTQHPPRAHHPPFSQPPPTLMPLSHGIYRSTPGHFDELYPHSSATRLGPPNTPVDHCDPLVPTNMTHKYQPQPPQKYHSCPLPRGIAQHRYNHRPEEMVPILYSYQNGYTNPPGFSVEKYEVHKIDDRKPAARDIPTPVQQQPLRIQCRFLDGSPAHFSTRSVLQSTTTQVLQCEKEKHFTEKKTEATQYNKEKPSNENKIDIGAGQLKFSRSMRPSVHTQVWQYDEENPFT